jgi:hypothetical protein
MRLKHRDSVFASIGRKDESTRFRHKHTCRRCESGHRFNVLISRDVDDVERIVAGMRKVETLGGRVNVSMIKTAGAAVFRQVYMTE